MAERSVQIEGLTNALPNERLWGAFRVRETQGSRLVLVGWVLGTQDEVKAVQVAVGGSIVASTAPSLPRPDMAEQFPERSAAATCGFELTLEAKGKGESILVLEAVFADATAAPIGEVRAVAPARRWSDVLRRH